MQLDEHRSTAAPTADPDEPVATETADDQSPRSVLGLPVTTERTATGEPVVPLWERLWMGFDRWGGLGLLGVSTVLSGLNAERTGGERLVTLAVAGAAAGWMLLLHVMTPREHLERRPWQAALYVTGLVAFMSALMSMDIQFWIFAVTGFLHAGLLRPRPLVYVGVAATSFVLHMWTFGGFPFPSSEEVVHFVALVVIQTLLIGSGIVGGERLMELNEERRHTVRRLEATLAENEGLHTQLVAQAREAGVHDERQRLARDIHDTLAQGFTGIITQLEAARQTRDDTALQRHLATAMDLARRSLDEARRSVQALGPASLHRGRLVDALHDLTGSWTDVYGVDVEVAVEGAADAIPADVEIALLGVAQEALNNTAKHAAAQRVAVTLSVLEDQVLLDVRDDGRGFDTGRRVSGGEDASGYGLTTMHQRVDRLGGHLNVESEPGVGTAIGAQVPLRPRHG